MDSFIINCRNCNDDPKWASLAPGHTRLSCPKDENCPSILDLIGSKNNQNTNIPLTRQKITRSRNRYFTHAEKKYCKETFTTLVNSTIKIQKFAKKYILK